VHTVYGRQMGARKSYNPKNQGKKSYQPILTFLAETREYISGELRNGDRPTGAQIARHLASVFAAPPQGIVQIFARDLLFIVSLAQFGGSGMASAGLPRETRGHAASLADDGILVCRKDATQ